MYSSFDTILYFLSAYHLLILSHHGEYLFMGNFQAIHDTHEKLWNVYIIPSPLESNNPHVQQCHSLSFDTRWM